LNETLSVVFFIVSTGAAMLLAVLWLQQRRQSLEQKSELGQLRESRLEFERQLTEARTMLRSEQQRNGELKADSEANRKQLQMEFEQLANKIFEDKQSKFSQLSKESLDATLRPMREQLDGFRKRVEEVHSADLMDRNRLKGQIDELHKQAQQIGQDAVSLAKALKGESKTQGDWGEMILERLLEDAGLTKGSEYIVQTGYRDTEGKLQKPDVILKLPEGRALIIDSKVSLKHYQDYVNSDDEAERGRLLNQHVASLRSHFKGLAGKRYQDLEDIESVDFVFMFIPIEPAYLLALRNDPQLFEDAFGQSVTLVSHTTLMPMLKTVESLWRNEKQNKNAREIAKQAGSMLDKFAGVVEALDELGGFIDKSQQAYERTRNRLSEGRGNLLGRAKKLKELGATTNKALPESTPEFSEDESDDKDA
jgi:DNA recombination protein RmuC